MTTEVRWNGQNVSDNTQRFLVLYFCHSNVDALLLTVALNNDAFCTSELGLVFVASLVNLIFLTISVGGWKGQSDVLTKSGPFNKLLSRKTLAAIPRVLAATGFSAGWTWFHSFLAVDSKISALRCATNTNCLSLQCSHWKTIVLSVHMMVLSICIVKVQWTSTLGRWARTAACNSSFGIVSASIGAARTLPITKASSGATISWNVGHFQRRCLAVQTTHFDVLVTGFLFLLAEFLCWLNSAADAKTSSAGFHSGSIWYISVIQIASATWHFQSLTSFNLLF